ncbi:fibronectin type III domain-containing protein [Zobellia amurskyensis]|uniref:Fibronectin type III domain-containing protein n=1 Tax=Zobellia amurskyensis TaxID=248905 RepID=A0A7X3D1Z2_9FLAO|nr:fibronectin type III domain-containing protein [Zobellia amurskyensis]MUH36541.1 fibronectin type III domain-containing protein [Zobellia amurskyensis]
MSNRAVEYMKYSMLQLQHFTNELICDSKRLLTTNFPLPTFLIRSLFLLVLLLNFFSVNSQSFPVQVIPQATPPSPIYFSDYADAGTLSSPLRVQIILNDFDVANREIRLRTYFSGGGIEFQSNDLVVGAEQLFLEGGTPLVLTNLQLAPYFRFENITGISPNVYGKAIPEGAYTFCFEVFDVLTGNRLSRRSCATSVVFQNDPPFLVSPRNKTNVQETNPQNIVFQWTPRHINVSNVEYELSIVEIWDTQIDPQAAFLSSPPVFQTTTSATTYVYGPADPLFLSGKNYAWRIQAKAKQGIEEIGLFENQGYTEIYSFSYAGSCDLPIGMNHEVKGSTNANIFWEDFSTDVPEYTIRYRQKNIEGAEWFMNKTSSNQTTLWDLKAGTVYEYQIQKKCSVTGSDWSIIKQFTTFIADDEASVYDCGITPDFDISNKEPLANINIGDKFTAGDFPINVLEVSGSNGYFTGKGYVTIPYLNSIRVGVKFTNVLINTDKKLAEGTVVTIYDPSLKNIIDIDDAIDTVEDAVDATGEFFEGDNDLDEIQVNWPVSKDDIKIVDEKVVITNPNTGATKSEPLGDDMVITDSEGKTYYIDADGQVTEGGAMDSGGAVTSGNVEGVSNTGQIESLTAQGIQVTFNQEGTYGIDIMPTGNIGKLKQEYTIIKNADGDDYPLTHHAVKNGATTKIEADIDIQNSTYAASDVIFKNKQGETISSSIDGNKATLTLTGRFSFENETIYAVVPDKEDNTKQLTAGAFTLWHLSERTIKVALVSVNGASLGSIEANVSNIFKKAVANIQFGDNLNLSVDKSELGANQQLDFGESAWAAAYNDEQKMLVNKVKQLAGYKSDTYYILVFNDIEPSRSIGGFMPLQRQMGFVFGGNPDEEDKGGDKSKTLAHEIGHGIFALQHPFTEYSINEDATDWLMDYGSGDQLPHTHWAQIHDPSLKFYIFQEEEDGEIAGKIWFSPNWDPIKVEGTNLIYTGHLTDNSPDLTNLPLGTIPGFTKDGKAYEAVFENGSFSGYYYGGLNGSKFPMETILQTGIGSDDKVYLYSYGGCGGSKYYSGKFYEINANKPNSTFDGFTFEDNISCSQENVPPSSNPFDLSFCEIFNEKETIEQSWIDNAVKNLKASHLKREDVLSETYREKSNFYHLVNHGSAFDDRANILEDKLYVLKQKTGVNFYVVFQQVTHQLTSNSLDEFAQKVLESSELPNDNDNVVVIIPFIRATTGVVSTIKCMQAGFAQSINTIVPTSYFDFKIQTDLFNYIIGAYEGIEKPATITYSYILANREISLVEKTANQNVRGLPFIQSLVVYKSNNYELLRNKEKKGRELKDKKPKKDDYDSTWEYVSARHDHQKLVTEWAIDYQESLESSIAQDKTALVEASSGDRSPPENYFEAVPGKKGVLLREVYLNPNTNKDLLVSYTNLHQAKEEYLDIFVNFEYTFGGSFEAVEGKHLYEEINKHQVVFSLLDATSLVLSPIGADILPDAIGLVYAISTGHKTEAGLYTVSFAAVGIAQWGVLYVKNSKKFTVVAKLGDDGAVLSYEIKNADQVISSANEKPLFSSMADNLDDAKKDFNDALDIDFGSEMAVGIDDAIQKELGSTVNIGIDAADNIADLTNYSNISKWLNEAPNADIQTILESWDDDLLKLLEADLASKSMADDLKSLLNNVDDIDIWNNFKTNPEKAFEKAKESANWDKWSRANFFKTATKKGTDFELNLLSKMKTRSGTEYNALKKKVPDLDDRFLLSQVQFCLPELSPPCLKKGEFFIADQVWLKYDAEGEIIDMVIVDAKLRKGTSYTLGQTAAKNNVGGYLSYKPVHSKKADDLNIGLPSEITQGNEIKTKAFYKAYGDGDKTFLDIN